MSSLILMRHGQASFGADVYDQLSATGEAQAAATGDFFRARSQRFDRVISGPLRRQEGSLRGVLDRLDHPPTLEIAPALAEFAEAQQVLRSSDHHAPVPRTVGSVPESRSARLKRHDSVIAAWAAGEARIDGAADMKTFRATVAGWFRELRAVSGGGQRVLAVTSAGVIGTLVCELFDLPDARMIEFTRMVQNASLTELMFTGARASLMSFNGTAHLPVELCTAT